MNYGCSCGATFETLTRKRLHQRDECPDRDLDLDLDGSDLDTDAISETVVSELLVCDICEASNDGAEAIGTDQTDAGLSIVLEFECEDCGAWNENTAILSGGST